MARQLLFGEARKDGKIRVWRTIHAKPGEELDERAYPEGYAYENAPEYPPPKRGIDYIKLFDPDTGEFSFEEKERPLTEQETMQEFAESIAALAKSVKDEADTVKELVTEIRAERLERVDR